MNKNRVSYFIDEKNKVVVASVVGCQGDAIQMFQRKFLNPCSQSIVVMLPLFNNEKAKMNFSYKAIARCSPDDVWDPEVGKRVAYNKLVEKYNAARLKRLEFISKNLYQASIDAIFYLKNIKDHGR